MALLTPSEQPKQAGAPTQPVFALWNLGFRPFYLLAGLFAVLGHNFPLWLKFQGGKGVATTLGTLVAFAWPVGLLACLTWLLTAALSRYSSLAALVCLSCAPFYAYGFGDGRAMALAGVLAILSIARHHANIRRLLKGEESKIGRKG